MSYDLKLALLVLLEDLGDPDGLRFNSDDEQYTQAIVRVLANHNEEFCLYKKYGLYDKCEFKEECNERKLGIGCNREPFKIARRFIDGHRGIENE